MLKSVIVASNCQTDAAAQVLKFGLTGTDIHQLHVPQLSDKKVALEWLPKFAAADIVFSLDLTAWVHADVREQLIGSIKRLEPIESIDFPGYHPDAALIRMTQGGYLGSPIGSNHSTICVAGYLAGLSDDQIKRQFNALTYRRLGYFDVFPTARVELIEKFARIGVDISTEFDRWSARGSFMYTVSHPKYFVIASVMQMAARRAGVDLPAAEYADFFPDLLSLDTVFPVYPELARELKATGSYVFKPPSATDMRVLRLDEFIRESTEIYRKSDPETWVLSDRVRQIAASMAGR